MVIATTGSVDVGDDQSRERSHERETCTAPLSRDTVPELEGLKDLPFSLCSLFLVLPYICSECHQNFRAYSSSRFWDY